MSPSARSEAGDILDQALVTLGLALIVGDLVTIIWGTQYHQAPEPHFLQTSTQIFGHYYPVYQLAVMVVGFVLFALVYTLVERTQLGAILRAAVEDADMVGALGINVRRVMLAVLVLGAGLATFAGVIGGPILSITPDVGDTVLIYALDRDRDRRPRLDHGRVRRLDHPR